MASEGWPWPSWLIGGVRWSSRSRSWGEKSSNEDDRADRSTAWGRFREGALGRINVYLTYRRILPPPPAGYPFVNVRKVVDFLEVLLCLYPWGWQPPIVVFSETRGTRTVVCVPRDIYIAAAAGRGDPP